MPAEYRATVLLGALGLLQGEVFGLRVGAIDFLRRTLTVRATLNEVEGNFVEGGGKTHSSRRTISVPDRVVEEVSAHLARTGRTDAENLLFQAPGAGPVRATNFRNRVHDPALRQAGLEGLSFHRLRHSAPGARRPVGGHPEAAGPLLHPDHNGHLWVLTRAGGPPRSREARRDVPGPLPTSDPVVQPQFFVVQMWCMLWARERSAEWTCRLAREFAGGGDGGGDGT